MIIIFKMENETNKSLNKVLLILLMMILLCSCILMDELIIKKDVTNSENSIHSFNPEQIIFNGLPSPRSTRTGKAIYIILGRNLDFT